MALAAAPLAAGEAASAGSDPPAGFDLRLDLDAINAAAPPADPDAGGDTAPRQEVRTKDASDAKGGLPTLNLRHDFDGWDVAPVVQGYRQDGEAIDLGDYSSEPLGLELRVRF